MGEVKSSIPQTQESIDNVIDDVVRKIAIKENDLEEEKGNEKKNEKSIVILKSALKLLHSAKKKLDEYKKT